MPTNRPLPCCCCFRVFNAHRAAQRVGKPYDMCHPCFYAHGAVLRATCLYDAVEEGRADFDDSPAPRCSCDTCELHGGA